MKNTLLGNRGRAHMGSRFNESLSPGNPQQDHRSRNWAEQHTHCPKCGFEGATGQDDRLYRWWLVVWVAEHLAPRLVGRSEECLFVRCKSCHYGWTEDVLELEPAPN